MLTKQNKSKPKQNNEIRYDEERVIDVPKSIERTNNGFAVNIPLTSQGEWFGAKSYEYRGSYYCRDSIQSIWDGKNPRMIFWIDLLGDEGRGKRVAGFIEGKRVAGFIGKFEEKLGISCRGRCKFGPISSHDGVWIEVSSFWRASCARRSLFTILLRCGRSFDTGCGTKEAVEAAFKRALTTEQYSRRTKDAIEFFLKGGTRINEKGLFRSGRGWYSILENLSAKQVKEHLRKPKKRAVN